MQFSEHWLRTYANPTLDSAALSHLLTMAGLEVEDTQALAPDFSHVVVGQIVSADKHPDADRLQLCKVDIGAAAPLQIVCGASNARVGIKVPCALVGAALPGFNIKQAKVRGIESFGMLCSAKELGLAEESSGLLELSADAPVGQDIRDWLDLNDQLLTLKLTPNRSDCLSLLGIARDVAALTATVLNVPAITAVAVTSDAQRKVLVDAPTACPRYTGRVITGVDARAQTPDWMVRRLERSGLRSISVIVDITNYVLLELGQPLHAFDAARLNGDIRVRFAQAGERLDLLNQQSVNLDTDMLVIADSQAPLALAGIMGGNASAVSDHTQSIFLESAYFEPATIVGKARRLNFSTDSSYRFERGVDFANTRNALEHASALILQICGGQAGPVTEVLNTLPARAPVTLRHARLESVLGIRFEAAAVTRMFAQLGFEHEVRGDDYLVTPPSYRFDIRIEEDLIEEVARLHGYDQIPATPPQAALNMLPAAESSLPAAALKACLTASGYQEIVSYSFVDLSWERDLLGNATPVALKNPIASNLSVMRSGLWGGLLDTLSYNLNRKQDRVRLFEVGAVYAAKDGGYTEHTRISGLAYGDASPEQWAEPARLVDFYDIKADVERLTGGIARYEPASHPALHPGQSAQVWLHGRMIGWLGKLHPKWQQYYDLPSCPVLFELELAALQKRTLAVYREVAKFPPVRRDLAVLVDEVVPLQALMDTLKQAQISHVVDLQLFDLYRGKGIPEGKKSLALSVFMQDTQKTLVDAEADAAMAKLLELLASQHGAVLR